jgi:hypothetical protein
VICLNEERKAIAEEKREAMLSKLTGDQWKKPTYTT